MRYVWRNLASYPNKWKKLRIKLISPMGIRGDQTPHAIYSYSFLHHMTPFSSARSLVGNRNRLQYAYTNTIGSFLEGDYTIFTKLEVRFNICRTDMMTGRASTYDEYIRGHGELLSRCVGFIYCTKIEMWSPGGPFITYVVLKGL